MITKLQKSLTVVALAVTMYLLSAPAPVFAVGPQDDTRCTDISYQDADGDGQPDLAVMLCDIVSSQDVVYVYDRGGDMQATGHWETSTDFDDDVWVFDTGGDGKANLIIDFHRDGPALVADVFDDQDGDGQVAYLVSAGVPVVKESPDPTVRVIAPDGWWTQNGTINFNLTILVDGPIRAAFGNTYYLRNLRTEGIIDFQIQVRDVNNDGSPDYQWVSARPMLFRSQIVAREKGVEPPIRGQMFWPYLGGSFLLVKNYKGSLPPIGVDFANSKIAGVGEFVASRGGEHNWFIYSLLPLWEGRENAANFENPFAFYDLAGDEDGVPELAIRNEYLNENDPFFMEGRFAQPVSLVRYSWDQDDDQTWDYKVGLLGRNEITSFVQLPWLSVQTVPYNDYPDWVVGLSWDAVSFVEVTAENYWTTEGVYANIGTTLDARNWYITGVSDRSPLPEVVDIGPGFRGECNLELQDQPVLYFSPVDRKLHLLRATRGVWNVNGAAKVRYENVNGDGYIDRWNYFEDDILTKTLVVTDGDVIYAGEDQVLILEAAIPHELFRTLPPRNHEDWLRLGEQLERHQGSFEPGDLQAMLSQFSGPLVRIVGASMEGFRLTSDGFRFVLGLQPGFRIENPDLLQGTTDLAPGTYLVTGGSELRITRLTPPEVTFASRSPQLDPDQPVELEAVDIKIVLRNDGLQDVESFPLVVYAEGPDGEAQEIDRMDVTVLGGESKEVFTTWVPRGPGEWRIQVEFDPSQAIPWMSGDVAGTWTSVNVSPAQRPGWQELVAPFATASVFHFALPLLGGCMITFAVATVRLIFTQSGQIGEN